jgi:hypothetical protein
MHDSTGTSHRHDNLLVECGTVFSPEKRVIQSLLSRQPLLGYKLSSAITNVSTTVLHGDYIEEVDEADRWRHHGHSFRSLG